MVSFKLRRIFYKFGLGQSFLGNVYAPDDNKEYELIACISEIKKQHFRKSDLSLSKLFDSLSVNSHKELAKLINQQFHSDQTEKINWSIMKAKAQICRSDNNLTAYEKVLGDYDPIVQLISTNETIATEFIGYGLGDDSLNVFRKVELKDEMLFEKVYLLDSPDFNRLEWFENFVRKEVEAIEYKVPKLIKIIKGEKLAIVYYQFLNEPLDNLKRPKKQLIEIAQNLNSLNLSNTAKLNFPKKSLDFTSIPIYQKSKAALIKWLQKSGIDAKKFDKYESLVMSLPRALNHGDLHGKNVGDNGVVIDWDRAGFYPIGFDIGYILSNTKNVTDLSLWQKEVMLLNCNIHLQKEKFLFAVTFFSAVFYFRKMGSRILPRELESMWLSLSNSDLSISSN